MKVIAVKISEGGSFAQVRLRPNFVVRLFGAPDVIVLLIRNEHPSAMHNRDVWKSATTLRDLPDLEHGDLIRRALEALSQIEHGEIPRAHIVSEDS